VAEEVNVFSVGDNGACSDGRSREEKYSGSQKCRIVARTECRGSF